MRCSGWMAVLHNPTSPDGRVPGTYHRALRFNARGREGPNLTQIKPVQIKSKQPNQTQIKCGRE
jgi:hypothetical protein